MDGLELPHPPVREQPALLRRLFRGPAPVLDELAARYGPNFTLGGGPARMAVIGEPTALREMFAMPSDHFRWGHKFNVLGFVVGDESMIVSDGDVHHRRRQAVQSGFSRRRLNGWIPMIVERTDIAIDALLEQLDGHDDVVDMYPVGRSLVLDIVVRSMFGERLAARATEIGELFQRAQNYLEAPALKQAPHPFPRTARARVRDDRKALDAIIDGEIAHLRAGPPVDEHGTADVLATLVHEGELSDSEMRDQVVTLMGAGFDTTAASLAWMFWCVSSVEGMWDRLRAEADVVFGQPGSPSSTGETPTFKTLAALDLANRTMRETTRLHPAGVISPREAARDLLVDGHRIRKGTLILWSPHLAGRNAEAWPDPLVFDPDRFGTEAKPLSSQLSPDQQALAQLAWVPFGHGARNCIGFALAQMELTLIISRMAQRLDIRTTGTNVPPPVGMVVNRPEGGAPMRVRTRS